MVSLYIYGKTKNGTMAEVFVCDLENETVAYNCLSISTKSKAHYSIKTDTF